MEGHRVKLCLKSRTNKMNPGIEKDGERDGEHELI